MITLQKTFLYVSMASFVLFIMYFISLSQNSVPHQRLFTEQGALSYSSWPHFRSKSNNDQALYHNCWSMDVKLDVHDMLVHQLSKLPTSKVESCRDLDLLIKSVYSINSRSSTRLELPPIFAAQVKSWLGNSDKLLHKLHQQEVIHVSQHMTGEHVVYNPVRSHRPMPHTAESGQMLVDRLALETQVACDFCNVDTRTAFDGFARHETNSSVRVSNTFKMERWHLMVVTKSPHHHPTKMSRSLYTAFVSDAVLLAREIMATELNMSHPHLAWDTLPKAGASQMHPHIHVLAAPLRYYGFTELLREAGEVHYRSTGRNLFNSMLEVHWSLNLTASYGDATALAMLSGKGDLEVMVLSEEPGNDLYSLMYFVTKAYHDSFEQYCYSLVMSWHGDKKSNVGVMPAMARIMSRGDCSSPRADYSSFEIYQAVYRQHDPWEVINAVRLAIKQYS
ncbi:uncharacterized protein LOC108682635 [Hyalella azteca]|uniref:Uncharacterized protein LOC108682635 n=1 Tax=Hyalella azteca TaxID=294128 RepID=A0A8B7PPV2_HYAAZ|nr:uncharacterized protein LOC108682635 [Hyalella azteca]